MPKWNDLLDYVDDDDVQLLCQKDANVMLRGYQILVAGIKADKTNYLYLIDEREVDKVEFVPGCSVAVFHESETKKESKLPDQVSNSLEVCGRTRICHFLAKINELFQIDADVNDALHRMQEVINREGGVQKLVDIVADLLGMTVDVLDNSFTFVASSRSYLDVSQVRQQYVHPGLRTPQDEMDYFRKTGILSKLVNATEPIAVHTRHYTTWTMPVTFNWMKIGYLVIFDLPEYSETRMNRLYRPYLPSIAVLLGIEMGKKELYTLNKASFYTHIMETILSGSNVSVEDIRKQLHVFNYTLCESMYLISVAPASLTVPNRKDTVLQDYLSRMFSNSIYVSQEFRWIFLVSRGANHLVTCEEVEDWNEYLRANNLYAGLTGPFYDFSDMKTRREETELAMEAGRHYPGQSITWFAEHQVDALVEQVRRKGTISQYCYRPVLDLQKYDEEHGSDLLVTLREYLSHPKEIAALCEQMHIHRNTLYSRLDKIRSIMNCDISQAEEIMKIQLTFHLLGIQNEK